MLRHPPVLSSALSAESSTPSRDRSRAAASGAVPFQGCRPQRRESTANSRIRFAFQNVRGFKDSPDGSNAKMDELVRHMQRSQVHVAMLAETWRLSQAELLVWNEEQDFLFLHHGLMPSDPTRGRFGLGFFLSPAAREAFNRAEAWQKFYGHRVFAIRLHWKDDRGRLVKCFVAVAHAPTTHHPAREHSEFRSHWQKMLAEVGQDEMLDLRVARNLRLNRLRTRPQRQFNTQSLRRPEVVREFRAAAVRAFSASTATDAGQPSTSTSLLSGLADNMPSASGRTLSSRMPAD